MSLGKRYSVRPSQASFMPRYTFQCLILNYAAIPWRVFVNTCQHLAVTLLARKTFLPSGCVRCTPCCKFVFLLPNVRHMVCSTCIWSTRVQIIINHCLLPVLRSTAIVREVRTTDAFWSHHCMESSHQSLRSVLTATTRSPWIWFLV